MGGLGSGDWTRFDTKSTVEQSLTVAVGDIHRRRRTHCSGTFTWTWTSGNKSSVGYFVNSSGNRLTVTLHYCWRDSEDVRIQVRLQTTPTHFGGERWWFTCPLIVGGVACNRRVGKLHLPPGAKYFGCRTCHGLTYRSSQQAHQAERIWGRLGLCYDARTIRRLARRFGPVG